MTELNKKLRHNLDHLNQHIKAAPGVPMGVIMRDWDLTSDERARLVDAVIAQRRVEMVKSEKSRLISPSEKSKSS